MKKELILQGKWSFSKDFSRRELEDSFAQLSEYGRLIKRNSFREIYTLPWKEKILFIKYYKKLPFFKKILVWMHILDHPAKQEWKILKDLEERGLEVVHPLGFGEKNFGGWPKIACFISLGAEGKPLSKVIPQIGLDWIPKIAKFLCQLEDLSIYHPDFHLENILYSPSHQMKVLDFQSARRLWGFSFFPSLRLKSLAKILQSLLIMGEKEKGDGLVNTFLSMSQNGKHIPQNSLRQKIWKEVKKLEKTRLKSRQKRIYKKSSSFDYKSWKKGRLYYHTSQSPEHWEKILEGGNHQQYQLLSFPRYPIKSWILKPEGQLYWEISRALWIQNIPHPQAMAYWQGPFQEKIIVVKEPPLFTLEEKLAERPLSHEEMQNLAKIVVRLHSHPFLRANLEGSALVFFPQKQWGLLHPTQVCQLGSPHRNGVIQNLKNLLALLGDQSKVWKELYIYEWRKRGALSFHPNHEKIQSILSV